MPVLETIRETLRRNSGTIVSGIGAALITPLIARIASDWAGRTVDRMWGIDPDDPSKTTGAASGEYGAGTTTGEEYFQEWTKKELYSLAQELDIYGRSTMNKAELIEAIRRHRGE